MRLLDYSFNKIFITFIENERTLQKFPYHFQSSENYKKNATFKATTLRIFFFWNQLLLWVMNYSRMEYQKHVLKKVNTNYAYFLITNKFSFGKKMLRVDFKKFSFLSCVKLNLKTFVLNSKNKKMFSQTWSQFRVCTKLYAARN